jgi:hypothetical protein
MCADEHLQHRCEYTSKSSGFESPRAFSRGKITATTQNSKVKLGEGAFRYLTTKSKP